jgi:hypothetical protein
MTPVAALQRVVELVHAETESDRLSAATSVAPSTNEGNLA